MTFDTIIIGGGLSGLTAGIALQQAGQRVAIAASGPGTLNYFSGSFDLLGYDSDGHILSHPLEGIPHLSPNHPYSKIGAERVAALAEEARNLLVQAGIALKGGDSNHYRITPMGVVKPAWLSMDECLTVESPSSVPYAKILLVNISGFLDFPVEFIRAGLGQMGADVSEATLSVNELHTRHKSPYETRATSIARLMANDEVLQEFADNLQSQISGNMPQAIVLPAVFGLTSDTTLRKLRELVNIPLYVIATMPPSLLGVRVQTQLRNRFTKLGGQIFHEAKVTSGIVYGGEVLGIATGYSEKVDAGSYILATGSFQSHGLVAGYRKVSEPIFNLDVEAPAGSMPHVAGGKPEGVSSFFSPQPYMQTGVKTDNAFHPYSNGQHVCNLYAVGSVLGGHDALSQADGTGVSLLTALAAAKDIVTQ